MLRILSTSVASIPCHLMRSEGVENLRMASVAWMPLDGSLPVHQGLCCTGSEGQSDGKDEK